MEMVKYYTIFEMDHPRDLRSFFWSPPTEPVLAEPEDEPPIISGSEENRDAVRAPYKYHGNYFYWKYQCELYNERKTTLANNKYKLFAILLMQCSPSVLDQLQAYHATDLAGGEACSDCKWLIETIQTSCCHKRAAVMQYGFSL
jgi:hypothetical protein